MEGKGRREMEGKIDMKREGKGKRQEGKGDKREQLTVGSSIHRVRSAHCRS